MMRFRLVLMLGLACWAGAAQAQSLLGGAQGQNDNNYNNENNTVAVPPAPPIVAAPPAAPLVQPALQPPPPGLVQTPLPPANSDAGAANSAPVDNGQPAAAPPPGPPPAGQAAATPPTAAVPDTSASLPPPLDNAWVPEHTAEIGILDKVDGGASTVSVPVGGQTVVGDLQINVLACESRPPTDVPDDAIFVAIQPANGQAAPPAAEASGSDPDAALFRGWMVRSVPGATVVGDGSETLRVVGCS